MAYNPIGAQTYTLASSISSTQNTILLNSFTEPVTGTPITMSTMNTTIAYGTISPKTATTEFISFTGITQNADGTALLTGVTRGLSRQYPFTSDAVFKIPHSGQSTFILSNSPQQVSEYPVKRNNESVTGYWDVPDPVGLQNIANKQWVLSVINGGTISFDQTIVAGEAGETLATGDSVYLDVSTQQWKKTDASNTATINDVKKGIAQGAGTAGNQITGGVLVYGVDNTQTGLTPGLVYVSDTPGEFSSSSGTNESVVGIAFSSTEMYYDPYFYYVLTAAQKSSLTSTPPTIQTFTPNQIGDDTTRFDVTNPSGSTFRYTYDGTGTDPNINSTTVPVGRILQIYSPNFSAGNNGVFVVTGSGNNYFEVSNPSGVVESDKTISNAGHLNIGRTWTKPANLSYAVVEVVGGGAGGGGVTAGAGATSGAGGGAAGGYTKKTILAASLGATEQLLVGYGGFGGGATADGGNGGDSYFTTSYIATAGSGGFGSASSSFPGGGTGGSGSGGDISISGQGGSGGNISVTSGATVTGGSGGSSYLGGGAKANNGSGSNGGSYGAGGSGGAANSGNGSGGAGANGIVIVTEYYS